MEIMALVWIYGIHHLAGGLVDVYHQNCAFYEKIFYVTVLSINHSSDCSIKPLS